MSASCFLWLLLICFSLPAAAEEKPDLGQLTFSASKLVDIREEGAKPFQMDLDFRAQIQIPEEGHLRLKWVSKDKWWREVTVRAYRQVDVKVGEMLYTSRNVPFTPVRIAQLFSLASVFSRDPQSRGDRVKAQSVEGISAYCLQYSSALPSHRSQHQEVCINPATSEVVTTQQKTDEEEQRQVFTNYVSFREHRFPTQMKLFVDKIEALRVNSVRLSDGSFEDSVFTPPPASIARRQCPHVQPPKAVKTPDPAYPKADSENGFMGTVFVSLTVLPDGSVDNVQLTGAATHGMNDVSQQILRTWKFKPAMCGGEPIAFDLTVEVYFRLSR